MSPRSSLSSLPTSPPSTPALVNDGGYFNLKVFSTATPAPGYDSPEYTTSGNRSPIVPPETVHATVIERYLPPSSQHEYDNIFSANLNSVLVDRMQELSRDNGTLTLIYPTKRGVQTFKRDHLGPILDPVIRRLIVTKSISFDVARHLENMPAVTHIDDFEGVKTKLLRLCQQLSEPGSERQPPNTPESPESRRQPDSSSLLCGDDISLVYSATEEVRVSRKFWSEWYFFQGAPRAKATLNSYWRNTHRRPSITEHPNMSASSLPSQQSKADTTSSMVLQEIYDGLNSSTTRDPQTGIEVGIFVLRRSRRESGRVS
ncbi:hypothetical protein KEM52_006063 [Ascosphaera acerosa]|nr:hypothetical protein KEM52_006063 [Ascosphaera acerosa]